MKVPNGYRNPHNLRISLSRLQNEGSQHADVAGSRGSKSIKATE